MQLVAGFRSLVRVCLFGAIAGAAGCSTDAPSAGQCDKLLDHLVSLEISGAGAKGLTPEMQADLNKQKSAVLSGKGPEFQKKCTKEMPGATVRCMLAATTLEEAAKCGVSS